MRYNFFISPEDYTGPLGIADGEVMADNEEEALTKAQDQARWALKDAPHGTLYKVEVYLATEEGTGFVGQEFAEDHR